MPAPTNISPATATVITTLPYSTTQDVYFGGVTYTVYFQYTATTTGELLPFFFGGVAGYQAKCTVVNAADVAIVFGLSTIAAFNVPIQHPTTAGTTYWYRVESITGTVTPAILTIDVRLFAPSQVIAGDLFINDIDLGFPAVVVSATASTTVKRFIPGLANGDYGAIVNDGTILLDDAVSGTRKLYTNQFAMLGSFYAGLGSGVANITSNHTNKFYVAFADRTVRKLSTVGTDAGVVASGLAAIPYAVAVSPSETILYYVDRTAAAGEPVRRWNLSTNLAMTDLAAGVATYKTGPKEILCLGDGKIVTVYSKTVTDLFIRIYNADGTVALTKTLTGYLGVTNIRLALAIDDPNSFWIWLEDSGTYPVATYFNLKVSDGSTLAGPFTERFYQTGIYSGAATATPTRSGQSESCPFVVLRTKIGITAVDPIRVVRRWQLPYETNLQVFISRLEVLIQSGVGLTAGASGSPVQGDDPTIMLRISKDGGKTWGNEQWRGMGKIGEYLARPYWNRLGRGRNLVAEIVCTDPVFVAFLDAFVDAEVGSS